MYCMVVSGDGVSYRECTTVKQARRSARIIASLDSFKTATIYRMTPAGDLTEEIIDTISLN